MKCPNCKAEMILEDESFDHPFGTEIIRYWWCDECDNNETYEDE